MSNEQFKDTNFEAADRKSIESILDGSMEFNPVSEIEESDYKLDEEIRKELAEAAERRELIAEKSADQDLEQDFREAKKNLRSLAERQQEVLDDLIAIAKASDSPRAYEVVATMLKTFADLEHNIMDLHKKKAEIEGKNKPAQEAGTINNSQNNYYVGSPRELSEFLKNDADREET